jgi:hypothetical protein
MGRYAVVGDSYAVLDQHHSHWAKLWAEKNNHTVELLGLEGSNHVNISSFVQNIDLTNYDGVIYQFTSLLRTETTSTNGATHNLCVADQLGKISIDEDNLFFDHCLPKTFKNYNINDNKCITEVHDEYTVTDVKVTPVNMIPYWYTGTSNEVINNMTDDYDKFLASRANGIYNNISIRWLVRANMMAYTSTIMMLNNMNIPNVTVFPTCGGFKPVQRYLKHKFSNINLWDQTDVCTLHPNDTDSRNHVTLELAKKLADSFIYL